MIITGPEIIICMYNLQMSREFVHDIIEITRKRSMPVSRQVVIFKLSIDPIIQSYH
jgi:hypothetical protein